MRIALIFCVFALFSPGCARRVAPTQSMEAPAGSITHAVIFYLKSPGNEAARRRIIDTTHSFSAIPGVLSVQVGTVLPSPRAVVDSGYDIAAVITFESESALRAYDQHPLHQAAVNGAMKELVSRVVIYDFTNR